MRFCSTYVRLVSQFRFSVINVLVILFLAGCSGQRSDTLKVGVISGPEAELMRVAADQAKKRFDLSVELVEFQDFITPNIALMDKSIDVNAIQHKPYLENIKRERGFKFDIVGNTFLYPIAAYSKKIQSIDQLPDRAKVALPNDPTNEGRALIVLHQSGLIKLKRADDLEAVPSNVIENPKKLQFIELDAAQLPRALDDVTVAFINSNYAVQSGLSPEQDALLTEKASSPYVNIIVCRAGDTVQDPRITKLLEAYQTPEVAEKAKQLFLGAAIPGWNVNSEKENSYLKAKGKIVKINPSKQSTVEETITVVN